MNRPFIVAEIGANHMGRMEEARALVTAARYAHADAVKFQTYTPEQMVAAGKVMEAGPWAGQDLLGLYRRCHTPREWHAELFQLARDHHLVPFSSVFHPDDVDFLETLGCPIYKIASFELTDYALIQHAAKTGKPLIISTGMANEYEISAAVRNAYYAGCKDLTLLKCTSAYPAPVEDANLATMADMRATYGVAVGLSDHTLGEAVAVAATVLGAQVIEKHFKGSSISRSPDSEFSMTPDQFKDMADDCRRAAKAIGEVRYGPQPSESANVMLRRPIGGMRGQLATTAEAT